jgi:hypothetical protein
MLQEPLRAGIRRGEFTLLPGCRGCRLAGWPPPPTPPRRILGLSTDFGKLFLGAFFSFLKNPIPKTRVRVGVVFPLTDPPLEKEVSDEARTCAVVNIGRPPPVLVGTAQVGHGRGVSVLAGWVSAAGWPSPHPATTPTPKTDSWTIDGFWKIISRNFFFFSEKPDTEFRAPVCSRFFHLRTHPSRRKSQTRLGPAPFV